jgi:hypothetical protein
MHKDTGFIHNAPLTHPALMPPTDGTCHQYARLDTIERDKIYQGMFLGEYDI